MLPQLRHKQLNCTTRIVLRTDRYCSRQTSNIRSLLERRVQYPIMCYEEILKLSFYLTFINEKNELSQRFLVGCIAALIAPYPPETSITLEMFLDFKIDSVITERYPPAQ